MHAWMGARENFWEMRARHEARDTSVIILERSSSSFLRRSISSCGSTSASACSSTQLSNSSHVTVPEPSLSIASNGFSFILQPAQAHCAARKS